VKTVPKVIQSIFYTLSNQKLFNIVENTTQHCLAYYLRVLMCVLGIVLDWIFFYYLVAISFDNTFNAPFELPQRLILSISLDFL